MLARSPSVAATKKRRQRARARAGVVVLNVAVVEHELAEALLASGRISEQAALDRRELANAAAGVLNEWMQRWRLKP